MVSLTALAVWSWSKRSRRHADAARTEGLAREWRRRRLTVELSAARADRQTALHQQQDALDRTVDLRKVGISQRCSPCHYLTS